MKDRDVVPFDLAAYRVASPYKASRLLFDWLCDDTQRVALYNHAATPPVWSFTSRAEEDLRGPIRPPRKPRGDPLVRPAHLVLDPGLVRQALADKGEVFSNLPYARIGSGGFMLALDPHCTAQHALQRDVARTLFCCPDTKALDALCQLAIKQAEPVWLATDSFDVAAFAQHAALRFCVIFFGFALKDYTLVEQAAQAGHAALSYTILARHFVTDPLVLPTAESAMGRLARRAGELIDAYALWPDKGHPDDGLGMPGRPGFESCIQRLGCGAGGALSGEQMAALVVGALAGTVGNIQSAVCIAVDALLRQPDAAKLNAAACERAVQAAWRAHPPVPFLPRRVRKTPGGPWPANVRAGDELILALGAGMGPDAASGDALVYGGGTHACVGMQLGNRLAQQLVRRVLALPSLARRFDSLDGTVMPLKKQWAFQCTAMPLTHRRVQRVQQQSLNVVMRVKSPVSESAMRLRELIRNAAPRIEEALVASQHVHFAWFEFHDQDHSLVLHTVYDGDFDAYVNHFALAVGDLFDLLFKFIEPAPPTPVADYPFEFVDMIRRFNRPPAAGYFFSAYPELGTAACLRLQAWRQQGQLDGEP
jgi:cytochrome P450